MRYKRYVIINIMSYVYLIRHGQKERMMGDPPLSAVGVAQAETTAKYFKDKNIEGIHSSPLRRTAETAGIIADKLKLTVKTNNRLRERMNWGDLQGESFDEFMEEWIKTDRNRQYQPIHGDSSYHAGKRMEDFLNSIKEDKNILVVTHGGIIGDLLRNLFPDKSLPTVENREAEIKYLEILECSITILKKGKAGFSLEKVGDISHLSVPLL